MGLLGDWESLMFPQAIRNAYTLYGKVNSFRSMGKEIFPAQGEIFRALLETPPSSTKVVILGQDPYPGVNEANGLAFSVNPDVPLPASLKNIYDELKDDLGIEPSNNGDLTKWARQGVLLLNTCLTVEHGYSGSHANLGWKAVTKEILNVCLELPQCIVFVGWGGYARDIISFLDLSSCPNKYALYSSHPSPLSVYKPLGSCPAFRGSHPFSKINEILKSNNSAEIDWNLCSN